MCMRASQQRPVSGGDSLVSGSYFKVRLRVCVCVCVGVGGAGTVGRDNLLLVTLLFQLLRQIKHNRLSRYLDIYCWMLTDRLWHWGSHCIWSLWQTQLLIKQCLIRTWPKGVQVGGKKSWAMTWNPGENTDVSNAVFKYQKRVSFHLEKDKTHTGIWSLNATVKNSQETNCDLVCKNAYVYACADKSAQGWAQGQDGRKELSKRPSANTFSFSVA